VGDLAQVKATHNSPYGLISSEWHRDGGKFDWQIEVPANTSAFVYLPAKSVEDATENGRSMAKTAGVTTVDNNQGRRLLIEVGSGKYHFTSELP
jgi:alpha-L-rhamnosidase